MIEDYKLFYAQHEELFEHLFSHNSIVFDRLNDVLTVMNFITKLEQKDITEDIELIFDVGFAYLFQKVTEINIYLEKNFDNNLHTFLKYEEFVNYALYLDDLIEVLEEQESYTDSLREGFQEILNKIEDIIEHKKQVHPEMIDDFNMLLLSLIPSGKEYLTTPEIFMRVAEELKI